MSRPRTAVVAAALACALLSASRAIAAEQGPSNPNRRVVYGPAVGATTGTFFDLPVRRLSLGFDVVDDIRSSMTALASVRIEPGQTENGLGAHRLELGGTLAVGRWIRVGLGPHLAYADDRP